MNIKHFPKRLAAALRVYTIPSSNSFDSEFRTSIATAGLNIRSVRSPRDFYSISNDQIIRMGRKYRSAKECNNEDSGLYKELKLRKLKVWESLVQRWSDLDDKEILLKAKEFKTQKDAGQLGAHVAKFRKHLIEKTGWSYKDSARNSCESWIHKYKRVPRQNSKDPSEKKFAQFWNQCLFRGERVGLWRNSMIDKYGLDAKRWEP